jgi:NAD(P)H dehydrogenase (quinone)
MSTGCCAAEALVLVYPVWNYGYPAILKGWFDRVFLPGVSFGLVDGKVRPTCTTSASSLS